MTKMKKLLRTKGLALYLIILSFRQFSIQVSGNKISVYSKLNFLLSLALIYMYLISCHWVLKPKNLEMFETLGVFFQYYFLLILCIHC